VSELARTHLPEPVREVVTRPLMHDTPAEMAQRELRDWAKGECKPGPGKTMPGLSYVERDYVNLHRRFVSFGPSVRTNGIGAHGISWAVDDLYDELVRDRPTIEWGGQRYPSI
jgi:nitrate reductase alpha subunit